MEIVQITNKIRRLSQITQNGSVFIQTVQQSYKSALEPNGAVETQISPR